MKTTVFTFFFSLLLSGQLFAQNPPVIACVHDTTNSFIDITWINDNAGCGASFTATNIYQSLTPGGPFTVVGSVTDPTETNFLDESAALLAGEIFYYVETDCSGTTTQSMTLSNRDPEPPTLVSVSVVGENEVEVTWAPGPFPSSFGTSIFRDINGGPTAIQNIDDFSVTQYIDPNVFPGDTVQEYDVSTLDGCSNTGSFSGLPHTTMHLVVTGDPCIEPLNFNWSPYLGWNAVAEYRILRNGVSVGVTSGTATPNVFDYNLQSDDTGDTCFAIEAESDTGVTSLSNEFCFDFSPPDLPSYIHLRNVSVEANNAISLEWFIDETQEAEGLNLQRGVTIADINQHFDLTDLPYMAIMDTDDSQLVNAGNFAYYYSVVADGTCGVEIRSGNARSIRLSASDNFNLTNALDWNAFEIENGTVSTYNIYRNDDSFSVPIASVPGNTLDYIDVIGEAGGDTGFCYRVEAIYDLDIPAIMVSESNLSSWSWEACVTQNSRIFMPNAFAPNGINSEFKPTIVHPNFEDYHMVILNKWGELIFESEDPDFGWDGMFRGNLAPQGVYAYVVQMKSLNGIQLERKGTVMLFR